MYDTFSVFGGNVLGDFTISNGTLTAGAVSISSLSTTGDISFGDNDKAIFGAGSDLSIYHDGSHSYIRENGTGSLLIQGSDLVLEDPDGNNYLHAADGGAVQLYNNGSSKLATTSTGVELQNTASGSETDILQIRNNATAASTASAIKFVNSTASGSNSGSTELVGIRTGTNTGDFVIRTSDSSAAMQERMRIDSSGNVGIGTTSPDAPLTVMESSNVAINVLKTNGNSLLKIGEDGNNHVVYNAIYNEQHFQANGTERMRIDNSGNLLVGKTNDADANAGVRVRGDGLVQATRANADPISANRTGNLGDVIAVRTDGSLRGTIGVEFTDNLFIAGDSSHVGLGFGSSAIYPSHGDSTTSSGDTTLGSSNNQFKDLYLSGGVYLGGTGSSNFLQDYEEGTWTPTTGGVSSWAFQTVRSATYTKVGRKVYITLNASLDGSSTANQIEIGGLPFTPASGDTGRANATPWMDYLDTGIVGTVHAGIWSANLKIRHYITRTDSNVNQSSVNSTILTLAV